MIEKLIYTITGYYCDKRVKYAKMKFSSLNALKDDFRVILPKKIIDKEDLNPRYTKRYLWLKWDIFKYRKCAICGREPKETKKLILVENYQNPYISGNSFYGKFLCSKCNTLFLYNQTLERIIKEEKDKRGEI